MPRFKVSDCQYAHVNGIKIRFYDKGKGKPLLLLHGFPDDLTVWSRMIPCLLESGYRVIAFDQRGFGESDMLPKQSDYQIDDIISDIPVLLDYLNVQEPINVMGHDWGAVIAWALCLSHPELVRASVNISVGHPESYRRSGLSQKLFKGFYTLWFQIPVFAEVYLKAGGLKRWLGNTMTLESSLASMQRKGRLTAGLRWYRANLTTILFKRWPDCNVPTLSVWSDGDRYLTEAQVLQSERFMSAEWRYLKVEHSGHWIPLEQPKLLCERAHAWFYQQSV